MQSSNFKLKNNRGITLMEILVSIAILGMLNLIGLWYFSKATNAQALEKDKQGLVAILQEARSLALSSKNALQYGVHLEEFQTVLFKGSTYDNKDQKFNRAIHLSAQSLNGGGIDIIFSRLTGETNNFGTITLSLINSPFSSVTITINNGGVIE